MMVKNAAIVTLLICLIACNEDRNYYVNHDKWKVPGMETRRAFAAKPVEVKETVYAHLPDSSFDQHLGRQVSRYTLYRFDADGNLIFQRSFFDSSSIYETTYTYNKDGLQVNLVATGDPTPRVTSSLSKLVSRKAEINKYKTDYYENGRIRYTEVFTYFDSGNRVVKERWERNLRQYSMTIFYTGNQVLKTIKQERNRVVEQNYYYSTAGFADSVITGVGARITARMRFINNKQGDPVYEEIRERNKGLKKLDEIPV